MLYRQTLLRAHRKNSRESSKNLYGVHFPQKWIKDLGFILLAFCVILWVDVRHNKVYYLNGTHIRVYAPLRFSFTPRKRHFFLRLVTRQKDDERTFALFQFVFDHLMRRFDSNLLYWIIFSSVEVSGLCEFVAFSYYVGVAPWIFP